MYKKQFLPLVKNGIILAYYNRLKNTIEFINDDAINKIMEKELGSVIHYARFGFTIEHEDSIFEIMLSKRITTKTQFAW